MEHVLTHPLVHSLTLQPPTSHVWIVRAVLRGHDPNRRLQHAQGHKGQCDHEAVGHWRTATLPEYVGTLLPWRQRHSVSHDEVSLKTISGLCMHASIYTCVCVCVCMYVCMMCVCCPFVLILHPLFAPLYRNRFVIDAADHDKLDAARTELRNLLDKPQLATIPVLVLGNKNDLPGALTVDQIIEVMNLKQIASREVSCYSISAKNQINIDITLQWLIKKGKSK